MENKTMSAVTGLVEGSCAVEVADIMNYRLTDENLSIFNVNGIVRKVQKSKLLEKYDLTVTESVPNKCTDLADMGFIWRLAIPTEEDRKKSDGSTYTWGDYAQKIAMIVLSRHEKAKTLI